MASELELKYPLFLIAASFICADLLSGDLCNDKLEQIVESKLSLLGLTYATSKAIFSIACQIGESPSSLFSF